MKIIHLLFGVAMLLAGSAHAELYRSIDKDGNVHYSDRPLEGTEDFVEVKVGKAPVPEEVLPYETQRAQQNFPVVLYVFPECGPGCNQAREFLNKRGIPFTEKSLAKQEDVDAFRKASGGSEVPSVTVGKTWLKGFLADEWNKELDFAGYPKTAPYRPKPAATPIPPAQ